MTGRFITNRKVSKEYAQIPSESYFQGMRVPWLRIGGNRQIQFMRNNDILFDHTISAPPGKIKYWPYTLDYRMPHKCYAANEQSCPTRRFPGTWEFVINQINGTILDGPSKGEYFCSMMESCPSRDYDAMLTLLRENFLAHYNTNRAPLGLFFHAVCQIPCRSQYEKLFVWFPRTMLSTFSAGSSTKDISLLCKPGSRKFSLTTPTCTSSPFTKP